ncbi:MAG TPA: hypothetical protein VHL31_13245 [Geminicoccus sp.]|jgi:hypothetical protein|uniref:DUF6898 family protein n=1 Tax=Geminicoccus sp. TaxID=2024832 RepID=UPI002E36F6E1|nr:hypothetical protein [Geminicoccus sp.]HEX2527247.1 hypothetical protein [Geminicoccus sp.]
MDRDDHGADGEAEQPILERRRIGSVVRVAAIDPATGLEVVIQGPAARDPLALERLVLRKLAWALDRAADRRNATD